MKLCALFLVLLLWDSAFAQAWPSKIRGCKVHDAKITVANNGDLSVAEGKNDTVVKLTDPTIADVGLSGLTIEIGAEITAGKQSGKVDFISFRDFRVNGIKVNVEEYNHSFSFQKGEPVVLPSPARVRISITEIPKAVFDELSEPEDELAVTGTVFVFGEFKKYGFRFKRVVPLTISMKIKNPLAS